MCVGRLAMARLCRSRGGKHESRCLHISTMRLHTRRCPPFMIARAITGVILAEVMPGQHAATCAMGMQRLYMERKGRHTRSGCALRGAANPQVTTRRSQSQPHLHNMRCNPLAWACTGRPRNSQMILKGIPGTGPGPNSDHLMTRAKARFQKGLG